MKIYCVKRTDETNFDESLACVLVAKDLKDVMAVLTENYFSPRHFWENNEYLEIKEIGVACAGVERGLVLENYLDG